MGLKLSIPQADYVQARFANPLLGRFLGVDPIGGNPRAPQSWNRYSYVLGNPLKYIDPTGMLGVLDPSDPHKESICVTASGAPCGGGLGASGHDNFVLTGMFGLTAGAGGGSRSAILDVATARSFYEGQLAAATSTAGIFFYDTLLDVLPESQGELGVTIAMTIIPGPLDNAAFAVVSSGLKRHALTTSLRQSRPRVWETTGGLRAAFNDFKILVRSGGGKRVHRPDYPGDLFRLRDGWYVGRRPVSRSSPYSPTIDLGTVKIKYHH